MEKFDRLLDAQLYAFQSYVSFLNATVDFANTKEQLSADVCTQHIYRLDDLKRRVDSSIHRYLYMLKEVTNEHSYYRDSVLKTIQSIISPKLETDTQTAQYAPGLHSNQK